MPDGLQRIILCFDNSELSSVASDITLNIASSFGSEVIGAHVYNAFMHEGAFRIMEPTLPPQFQREDILLKQRKLHNTLINVGMEKISLSYMKPLEDMFRASQIDFKPIVKEGKNFKALNDILGEMDADLIVIGSSGFNSNGKGFIGSVCLRVIRNNNMDFLVVKGSLDLHSPKFIVCLDGSSTAINALRKAMLLANKYNAEIHLVYVFDSALHKDVFGRLKESLINRDGFSFNTKEQEKIHDEFIDKGLARVGRMILDRAEREVFEGQGARGKGQDKAIKRVLEGHIYKRICDYAKDVKADLIFLGRTGRHFVDGMDIGSVTENVLRFSPCNVYVTRHKEFKGWDL